MKLHIEHAGNGQTIIASESGPVAYMAPDLPEALGDSLAATFAAAPAFLTDLTRIAKLEAENAQLRTSLATACTDRNLAMTALGARD